jgi:hypothetical protein
MSRHTRTAESARAPRTAAERMRRYRARRRAAGLRLERRWVPAGTRAGTTAVRSYSDHRILEARSLALHCLIVLKIERDPRLLQIAHRNLARWLDRDGRAPRALLEWRAILEQPWPAIAAILTDPGEEAARLRQSTPFAGVLTKAERRRVYEAFRA